MAVCMKSKGPFTFLWTVVERLCVALGQAYSLWKSDMTYIFFKTCHVYHNPWFLLWCRWYAAHYALGGIETELYFNALTILLGCNVQ